MPRIAYIAVASLTLAIGVRPSAAQEKARKPASAPTQAVSAVQESAAIDFAEANHPELADLLDRLKSSDRGSYEKAVREIAETSERLTKIRDSDPDRHALMVRNWTLDSRARLLTARLTMSGDPGLRDQLKSLLRERQEGKLALLRFDRKRTAARLDKIDAQIEDLERDGRADLERDLAKIDRAVAASGRVAGKKKPRPESKAKASDAPAKKPRDETKPADRR